jgi:hypothetical protein
MNTEVAGSIAAWRPASAPPQAAEFARQVVAACGPLGRDRAKNLLWAAGKLAAYGTGLGLEAVPEVLLHPSVIERSAPRSAVFISPAKRGEIGGISLDRMANPGPKGDPGTAACQETGGHAQAYGVMR